MVTDETATWESGGSGWSLLWGTQPHVWLALQKWLQECGLPFGGGGSGEGLWPVSQLFLTPSSWPNRVGGRAVRLPRGARAEKDKGQADLGGFSGLALRGPG